MTKGESPTIRPARSSNSFWMGVVFLSYLWYYKSVPKGTKKRNALTMGRKLGNMGNLMGDVLVVGNELNKVDTLKSLAKTALNSGEMVGEIIGGGVLANAEGLADKVYTETVEMLALYLATLVDGDAEDAEDEDEDEDESLSCIRCGAVENVGDWLDGDYICYECMSAEEYRNL